MATGFPVKANYATGDVLTAANMNDLSGTVNYLQYMPPRNPVLNSAFNVWQRGTSVTPSSSAGAYTADRWYITRGSNTSATVSRQATNDSTNLPQIQYCSRVQRTAATSTTTDVAFGQMMETINSIPYSGQTVTLSAYIRKGANFSSTSDLLTMQIINGTGTDQKQMDGGYTGSNVAVTGNKTLTTTWQRFSISGTIPTNSTELTLKFSYTPTGTAGTDDYFEVTGVQLELGSAANTYMPNQPTYQGELAACQRYYTRYTSGNLYGIMGSGIASNTGSLQVFFPFPVPMRTIPTALDSSAVGTFYWEGGSSSGNTPTNVTIGGSISASVGQALVNKTSGFTTGAAYALYGNNTTTAYVGFSAEL